MALLLEDYVRVFGEPEFKKIRKRGTSAYSDKHVISYSYDAAANAIVCLVLPSMKQGKAYKVTASVFVPILLNIELRADNSIAELHYTCANGQVQCHHMVAACLHCVHNISKTDVLCKWVRSKDPKDSEGICCSLLRIKKCADLFPESYSFAALKIPVTEEDLRDLVKRMKEVASACGFVWLHEPEPDAEIELAVATFTELIMKKEFVKRSDPFSLLMKLLELCPQEIAFIEERTRGQHTNHLWHLYRDGKLSGSIIGCILLRYGKRRFPPSFWKKLFHEYNSTTKKGPLKYGTDNEDNAIEAYENHTDLKVQRLGFIRHPCGIFGGSLDGLVEMNAESTKRICVECKCPYSASEDGIFHKITTDPSFSLKFNDKNDLFLDVDINTTKLDGTATEYYHQVENNMLVANCEEAHLIVWSPKDYAIVIIPRDKEWESNVVPILKDFYQTFYLPKYFETH